MAKELSREDKQDLLFMRWRESMEAFVEEALGVDGKRGWSISTQQREACREVSKLVNAKIKRLYNHPMTEEENAYANKLGMSIMSGQGSGKDAWASWFILWFEICFKHVLIPCTAPSADQLKNILWMEVSRWLNRTGNDGLPIVDPLIRNNIIVQTDRIFRKPPKGKEPINFAFPKTANPKDDPEAQAKTLFGYHDIHMAIILDDAAGINDAVYKPLEGTVTKDVNFMLILFNPIFNIGFAMETHTGGFTDKWILLHWDSEDSEIVTKEHIKDMEDKYGRESNTFRTLVKGLPPIADNDSIIPYAWVMEAIKREIIPDPYEPRIGGCDPGAGGDNTILRIRHGLKIEEVRYKFSSPNSVEVGDWAAAIAIEENLDALFFDVIGIGNGAYYEAKRVLQGHKCKVYAVDVRNKARDEDKYVNLNAELTYRMRDYFEKGTISIPHHQFLIEELSAPRRKPEGRKEGIESKYDVKKRLKYNRSPNDGDAVKLTFAKNDLIFRHTTETEERRIIRSGRYSEQRRNQNSWMRA